MTIRLANALHVYLCQRWAVPILGLAVLIWSVVVFSMSQSSDQPPLLICTVIGFPVMGVAFWVTSVAKWQFVNPRARLLPGFAAPHVAVIAGWFALGMGLFPLIVGLILPAFDPLAAVAYGSLCGALFVWAIHTAKPMLVLLGMLVYFSPAAPFTQPLWARPAPWATVLWLAVVLVGAAGIALWLRVLVRLTEESEAYVIPTQAQSGKASRMEKSEARRNVALHLSRSKLAGRIIDWWADPLIGRHAQTVAERQSLLPFGQSGSPAWLRSLWLLSVAMILIGINVLIVAPSSRPGIEMATPAVLMLALLGPAFSTQLLAMRRPRMQSELLLPMTRRQYIDGLFRMLAVEAVQFWGASVGLLGVIVWALAPDFLRAEWVVGALLAAGASLVAAFGVCTLTGLVESGLKRMLVLIVGLYAIAGLVLAAVALYRYVHAGFGYGMVGVVLAAGAVLIKEAHRRWLNAELG